ncbi:hypothetical protein JRI60_40765 [Archangium violaceum]|uniref:hypothetical protein n=1 Tax=Archangium violaceum TaxID=83451 RepID=UPI001950AFCA|nr:hypothetical protein [Archangium violaceum]QRN95347.1 hypothetical protein JRI60_40765 [Archangium violaceum]
MKRLKSSDLKAEDSLTFTFEGAFDQQAALDRQLEPVLQALEEYAGEWMPDVVEGKRQRKYSRAAIWKSMEEKRDENSTSIVLGRTKWPVLYMRLRLYFPPLPPELRITLEVKPLSFFSEAERCRKLVDMVRAWATHHPVTHADASSLAEDQLSDAPFFGRDLQTSVRDGFDKLYALSWLNVFGPKLVEAVGRERMLSTPAHRVEELPNGSILLVTWPIAADFASDEARQAQARAFVHLRPDLVLDTELSTLRERSAALAPVEPRFHPDLAPLLSRVVDHVTVGERQRKIAELNAYQPPKPDEWLPVESALPPDVEDPERVRQYYAHLAERLVALLHSKVPSVLEETPESLTDVDAYFWCEDFPRVFERERIDEHAVPAVAAYLGEVLVRNLGGQWIPRKKLGEMQVRVGPRVWFPYVRAHRYMRSRQSLLDHSLTQLYRVAERHRS